MIERYCAGKVPEVPPLDQLDVIAPAHALGGQAVQAQRALGDQAIALRERVSHAMEELHFSVALEAIMRLVTQANQFVEVSAPWKLAKQPEEAKRLDRVLAVLAEVLRIITILLDPFMPTVSEAVWRQLGCRGPRRFADAGRWGGLPAGQALGPHPVLFPRRQAAGRP